MGAKGAGMQLRLICFAVKRLEKGCGRRLGAARHPLPFGGIKTVVEPLELNGIFPVKRVLSRIDRAVRGADIERLAGFSLKHQRAGDAHCAGGVKLVGVEEDFCLDRLRRGGGAVAMRLDTGAHFLNERFFKTVFTQKRCGFPSAFLRMAEAGVVILLPARDIVQQTGGDEDVRANPGSVSAIFSARASTR